MSTNNGYTQNISTADFSQTPRLTIEQPTGDVHIQGWDQPAIEVAIAGSEGLFELEQDGSLVTVRSRPGSYKLVNFLEPVTEGLQNLGIGLERVAAKVERNVERSMRRMSKGFGPYMDPSSWAGGCDYYIKVPYDCDLNLRTSTGDLSVEQVNGTLFIQSTSGDIRMQRVGGNLVVHSASGDITINGVEGKLGARSASGDIKGDKANLAEVSVNSASGDIELGLLRVPERGCEVHTVSGDLTLSLPADARVTAEVATLSGDISCGFQRDQVAYNAQHRRGASLTINGGGPLARLGSTSGDVLIRARREESAPPAPAQPDVPGTPTTDLSRSTPSTEGENARATSPEAKDRTEPEGYAERRQAALEILKAVERGELTSQQAMEHLANIEGE